MQLCGQNERSSWWLKSSLNLNESKQSRLSITSRDSQLPSRTLGWKRVLWLFEFLILSMTFGEVFGILCNCVNFKPEPMIQRLYISKRSRSFKWWCFWFPKTVFRKFKNAIYRTNLTGAKSSVFLLTLASKILIMFFFLSFYPEHHWSPRLQLPVIKNYEQNNSRQQSEP